MKTKLFIAFVAALIATPAYAKAPHTAYYRIVNQTGKDIVNLHVSARYANKTSANKGVDWRDSIDIKNLKDGEASDKYTAKYNYGFGTTGQNYWSIWATFNDGSGIAPSWDGNKPKESWKQCSFSGPDKKKVLVIILKKEGKVRYEMPKSSSCNESLKSYKPISPLSKLYSISHMTNTPQAVTWASGNGANAVEADLEFDGSGVPKQFKHGSPSDCAAYPLKKPAASICKVVGGKSVGKIKPWFKAIRDVGMPLVIIDSKVNFDEKSKIERAGLEVARIIKEELYNKGYNGKVFVGVAKTKYVHYLETVRNAIKGSSFEKNVYFSIDQEGDNFEKAYQALSTLNTTQIVFGTGISVISPGTYFKGIKKAVQARERGDIKFVYIWTIDKQSSMKDYLKAKVDGVMTNEPAVLTHIIRSNGSVESFQPHFPTLATMGDPIPSPRR